jgi:phosphoribosylaminoimidazolecarboxamide formyltransferase/IMP cyclohydrolase
MAEAFAHTAEYDSMIAEYFSRQLPATSESSTEPFPEELRLALRRVDVLRYGENPHQRAALYADAVAAAPGGSLVTAKQLAGKELSYNNLLDLDSALALARSLSDAATVVIKHNNPCGAASALTLAEATNNALEGDPLSAFGSILGMNRPVDMATAERLAAPGLFIEAIVAPGFAPEALELLTTRPKWHKSVRLMQVDSLDLSPGQRSYRFIEGGLLVQDADVDPDPIDQWRVVTQAAPTDAQYDDLRFAWAVVRHVKSNAIVLAQGRAVCGVGAGQMSRVDSVDIAVAKAGDRARGSAMASDAFFPFADSIDKAQAAGVAAVVQPGGSRGDDQVIEACNRHGLAMVFTGRRHFKH